MEKKNTVCSGGSGGFKVGTDLKITMADIDAHERNLQMIEDKKSNKK